MALDVEWMESMYPTGHISCRRLTRSDRYLALAAMYLAATHLAAMHLVTIHLAAMYFVKKMMESMTEI